MEKRHGKESKHKSSFDWEKWRNILLVGLTIILIINISIIFFIQGKIKDVQKATEEALRPGNIELISILDKNCKECSNINPLATLIKEKNVKIVKESELSINGKEAKDMIAKYRITRIPTLIVTGELDKVNFLAEIMERKDDAFVLTQVPAPYVDAQSGKIRGIVESILIYKKDCEKCTDLSQLLLQIKNGGIYLGKEDSYESGSKESLDILKKYDIKRLPALIFSSDLGDYEQVRQNWQAVGTIDTDGRYIFRNINPPYYDVQKKEIVGLVGIVYITDKDCANCYDVNLHRQILAGLGVIFGHESTYDISTEDGKELLLEYNITKVPTIFMSNDLRVYPQITEVWKQVGTIDTNAAENETVYTFRATEVMGTYHDLKTGQIVEPQQG